ncbi:MAG: DUF4406 domain-containing protein [Atopobiaceae bacterium]|nr:DUF4406 domain-containing protein [Atopobiaceae bacterium]
MSYNYKGKRVFISGPMTGKPDWNRAEFERAAIELWELGAGAVFNPASIAPREGEPAMAHELYMARTLNRLTVLDFTGFPNVPYYDVIVMLDGWWDSEGAKVERMVAEAIGLDVVEWDEPEYL